MRSNSFALHICIILILVNCSACAEHVEFAQVKQANGDVTANNLFTINAFNESENVHSGNRSSFNDDDKYDYAQKNSMNESKWQKNEDDAVSLPNQNGYYHYENSNSQSIADSQRHERAAEPQDMCDTSECKCKLDSKFLTVDCYFQQVSTFIQSTIYLVSRSIGLPICSTLWHNAIISMFD